MLLYLTTAGHLHQQMTGHLLDANWPIQQYTSLSLHAASWCRYNCQFCKLLNIVLFYMINYCKGIFKWKLRLKLTCLCGAVSWHSAEQLQGWNSERCTSACHWKWEVKYEKLFTLHPLFNLPLPTPSPPLSVRLSVCMWTWPNPQCKENTEVPELKHDSDRKKGVPQSPGASHGERQVNTVYLIILWLYHIHHHATKVRDVNILD